MSNESNWKENSGDVSRVTQKIKSNISSDENIEDLKISLKVAKESISSSLNELVKILENTVKDEGIKEDALILVNNLRQEMVNVVDVGKEKISKVTDYITLEEE